MIVTANRPYFAPFPAFFYRAHLADAFVILDSVQFPQGTTWITRNRFKNDQGTLWMTIPVWKKGLGLQNIDQVRVCREGGWPRKHPASLYQAYANAPYFYEHFQFLETLFSTASGRLIDFNLAVIRHLMQNFGLDTDIIRFSELNIDAAGDRLLIEVCRYFEASVYLASAAACRHLNAALFKKAGIELRPVKDHSPVYPQLWGDFIPDLSAFDLLFNCGPKARDILLAQ